MVGPFSKAGVYLILNEFSRKILVFREMVSRYSRNILSQCIYSLLPWLPL